MDEDKHLSKSHSRASCTKPFNFEVMDKLQRAITASTTEEKDQLIHKAIDLLEERNHKIRITNSSEAGWLTVKHYESSAVALSPEDDKKIHAAEKEAIREHGRNRTKRNVERAQGRWQVSSLQLSLVFT